MTCFRMKDGQTLMSYCKKNKIPYANAWRRLDSGLDVETAIKFAKKAKGNGIIHPKYFYNGEPLIKLFPKKDYERICILMRTRGFSMEKAISYIKMGKRYSYREENKQ